MDTEIQSIYAKWIKDLPENSFNDLVLAYIRSYYKTNDVHITNGPYDGGLDLMVYKDGKQIKRNIQVTIQRPPIEKKIIEDLEKSRDNVERYLYLNKLDYYYSQNLTPTKKNDLTVLAETDYGIELNIYDNVRLAGLVDIYPGMKLVLQKLKDEIFPPKNLKIDSNLKVLYDTLSLNKDVTEIKIGFIRSFILFHFYKNGASTVKDTYESINEIFYDYYDKSFYEQQIGKLNQENKISVVINSIPKKFELTQTIKERIKEIDENTSVYEQDLIVSCEKICSKYGIQLDSDEIFSRVLNLYNENYKIDLDEIQRGTTDRSKEIRKLYDELKNYVKIKTNKSEDDATKITDELLQIYLGNNLINKCSVSKMFVNLFRDDKLDDYLSQSEREVYLDTQILLQLICVLYRKDEEYDNLLYKITSEFLNTVENSNTKISLFTTKGYVEEVSRHLLNALKLERFLHLPYIQSLGQSKNVFFNFYLFLKDNYLDYESLTDFVLDLLGLEFINIDNANVVDIITKQISDRLQSISDTPIEIESPPEFQEYSKYRKEYENVLSYLHYDQKSYEARKNDLNAVLHLSKDANYEEPPYFITWDSSFYKVREAFGRKFSELGFWYLYSPQKFSNTVSVMNMKINPKSVNYNIISLVEDNFHTSNDSISVFDILNNLFDNQDTSKWKLANKFAKLRGDIIKTEDSEKVENENLPIDELVLLLQNYYTSNHEGYKYEDFKNAMIDNDISDGIISLLKKHMNNFRTKEHKILPEITTEMDLLIQQSQNKALH